MSGRRSRNKGKVGERECAKFLSELLGLDVKRGVQFQGGPDSPDVVGVPGIHVEVKRVESLRLLPALDQARSDAGSESVPLVMWRKSHHDWVACVDATRLLDLARALMEISPQ
tara:strand:- start:2072 stop:2410 length:339 start_codon:yes stop_codon:yes gene_type:complete